MPSQTLDPAAFLPLAHKLANAIQWTPEDHDDLVQEGLLELTKQFATYQARGVEIRNPMGVAAQIMARWMKWWYKPADRQDRVVVLEASDPVFQSRVTQALDERFLTEYLREVERMVGPVEAKMAQALLWGTPESIATALATHMDKQSRHERGEKVKGVHTFVHTHEHIRSSLNLGEWEWERRLKSLRLFTRSYLARTSTGEPLSSPGPVD